MKNKSFSGKYILYVIIFMVTAIVTFISMHYKTESAASVLMSEATLPVVMAKTEAGTLYNAMHGYTCEIDYSRLSTDLTLLPSDKKLAIAIDTYGESVSSISYKIRDSRDMSLIESTKVENFDSSPSRVEAVLNIKNLISDEVKYILEITLNTKNHENVYYYTTVVSGMSDGIQEKLDYVIEFNKNTYDASNVNEISKYLETTASADNSNYGKINIYNSLDQVRWGDLHPFIESNIIPSLYESDGDTAVIAIDYTVGAGNDNDSYDTYTVHEYYRIRKTTRAMYLLNFERESNQVFDGRNDLLSSGKINLGIQPDSDIELMDDDKNNYTYFENEGSLWCYDKSSNTFTKVFAFASDDTDNIRERYERHKIKILDVTEDGNAQFIVYGYMNRGIHEGATGVSLYSYNYVSNETEELLFIPVNMSYEALCETVGDVAYVSDDRSFYIVLNDTMYSISLDSREVMTAIDKMSKGTYKVSGNGRIIAYSTNGELYNTDSIRVFNMERANDYTIDAPHGDKLMVLGYVNTDFIYGIAHSTDIINDENGITTFPMYKVCIMNEDYELIKEYEQDGVYVSSANVDGLRINLDRVAKSDSGYSSVSVDQLINKDENNTSEHASFDIISTSLRKVEQVIVLPKGGGKPDSVITRAAGSVEYKENRTIDINDIHIGTCERYNVIGKGRYYNSYDDADKAIVAAAGNYGNVYDGENNIIWKRFKTSSYMIKGFSLSSSYGNSYAAASHAVESFMGSDKNLTRLTLKGISFENALSFVSDGKPVIAKTDDGYVVITAYDTSNVTYIDASTGSEVTQTQANATKLFTQAGNIYVTYYKK